MRMTANREGFALPMAILVIGMMTAGVVASFTRVGAEAHTLDNSRAQTVAFSIAEAGLARVMAGGKLGAGVDSMTSTYTDPSGLGNATMTAYRLYTVDNASVVLVRSTGTARSPGGRPGATRTVAQFAVQRPMQMQVKSAWTSLSGVFANGNAGDFDGNDQAGAACGDGVTRAGIAVPTGTATSTGTNNSHIHERAKGDPPIDNMGSKQDAADAIEIDWAGIINPTNPKIAPNVVHCAGSGTTGYVTGLGPCGSWPGPAAMEGYPTIIINGSMDLPSSGKGMLIVTGNLRIMGSQDWDGVILVGGRITDNGQGNITGAVVSGLNMKLGATVDESSVDLSVANGTKRYQFNSCSVQNALMGATSGFHAIPNAWVDNWVTY